MQDRGVILSGGWDGSFGGKGNSGTTLVGGFTAVTGDSRIKKIFAKGGLEVTGGVREHDAVVHP